MNLTPQIKEVFTNCAVIPFATSNTDGIPNVSLIASKKIVNDNTIWTIDTFHNKTLENIKHNPNISIAIWQKSEGYQIKGTAIYYTNGEKFETAKKWILKLKPNKIVKGLIEITVTDIYYLTPNYELAGKPVSNINF